MPTPPAGFQQVNAFYDLEQQATDDAEVVFGVALPAFDQTNVDALFGIFTSTFKNVLSGSANITRIEVHDSSLATITSTGAPENGTVSGDPMTPQVAYLVKKLTALGGRRNRGRFYLPGVVESKVDGAGNVLGAFQTTIQTSMDDFMTDTGAADIGVVILHSDGGTPTDVTSLQVEPKVATQRRRLKR